MMNNDSTYIFNFVDNNINNTPLLIGIKEACKFVGIGRNTLLKLSKQKGFPALIFPHKILIDKKQLPIWLSKNYGRDKN